MEDMHELLLVEDDPRDVRMTLQVIQSSYPKCKVEVARDGEEALDFLFCRGTFSGRSQTRPPKLVLLDLKLPKVDGLQVLSEVKAAPVTRAIPIVVLTSSREEKDMVESYRLGVNSYIQKPVDFENFQATIKALGLYWLSVNQPPPEKAFTEE